MKDLYSLKKTFLDFFMWLYGHRGYKRPLLVQDDAPGTRVSYTDLGGLHCEDEVCPVQVT